jgi:hypothetical protein
MIRKLSRMCKIYSRLTTEMREGISKLIMMFSSVYTMIQRIENSLPTRISCPIVIFTDALGETMALPYQLCQQWTTFRRLLGVMFDKKPGKNRVEMGQYLIINTQGGRLLQEASWQHAVKQNDHLSMSIVLDDLQAKDGHCPFPSCRTSLSCAEVENGGRICPECGRWVILTPRKSFSGFTLIKIPWQVESEVDGIDGWQPGSASGSRDELPFPENNEQDPEDIEVYRQIHVKTVVDDQTKQSVYLDDNVCLIHCVWLRILAHVNRRTSALKRSP